MPILIAGAVAVLVLYLLLQMFRAANPALLARALKIAGGIVALAVAAFVGLRGHEGPLFLRKENAATLGQIPICGRIEIASAPGLRQTSAGNPSEAFYLSD